MTKAKLSKMLQHLKTLQLNKGGARLWIMKRTLKSGAASYHLASVKTDAHLQRKLVQIVAGAVNAASRVQVYDYLTADQDEDTALGLDVAETDLSVIADQIAQGSDAPQITEPEGLFDSWAYAVELTVSKEQIIGVRKISEGWKLKQQDRFLSAIFKDHMLLDYEDEPVFKLDKFIDFFAYGGGLFILDKKRFEAAMNFRAGMESHMTALLEEFETLDLVTDVEIIRTKAVARLSHLRKIAMIKNSGYFRLPGYMAKVKQVCAEKKWNIQFDGDKVIVTEENVELLLTLLNNDRLASLLTEEIFDVAVKHKVE
jgi:hypothetical protein